MYINIILRLDLLTRILRPMWEEFVESRGKLYTEEFRGFYSSSNEGE